MQKDSFSILSRENLRDCERIQNQAQKFMAEATEVGNSSYFSRNFTLVGKFAIKELFFSFLGKNLFSLTIS